MTSTTFTIPTIETERLWLRAPRLSDFEPEAKLFASKRCAYIGRRMARGRVWRWLAPVIGHWAYRILGWDTANSMILHGNALNMSGSAPCHIFRHPSLEALT